MQLGKDKIATINYTLKDKDNNILDQCNDGSFTYLHGNKSLMPGLEKELEGKQPGDEINVVIKPEDGYGERSLDKIQRVPKKIFPPNVEIKEGMQFNSQTSKGDSIVLTVTAIEEHEVVADGNHPLAGIQLHFEVELIDVRDATEEEIQHGHVHGPGGHEH